MQKTYFKKPSNSIGELKRHFFFFWKCDGANLTLDNDSIFLEVIFVPTSYFTWWFYKVMWSILPFLPLCLQIPIYFWLSEPLKAQIWTLAQTNVIFFGASCCVLQISKYEKPFAYHQEWKNLKWIDVDFFLFCDKHFITFLCKKKVHTFIWYCL